MKLAEDIIISKRYFELTSAEREVVKELATNEEEYEAMRWFLISTGDAFASEKIEPTRDLRKGVMAHLQQKQTAPKTIWLNGVSAFLFPSEKKFYQYPALQIAAVAVLLVSIVAVYNTSADLNQTLAVNDTPLAEQPEKNTVSDLDANQPDATIAPEEEVSTLGTSVDSRNEMTERLEAPADMAPAEAAYYREMSVAEEIKAESDVVLMDELANDQSVANTSTVVDESPVQYTGAINQKYDQDKAEVSKSKDSEKGAKLDSKKENNVRTDNATSLSTNVPAGPQNTTKNTEKNVAEEKEGGGYVTGTAGGVYGETAADSVATGDDKTEEEQQSKKFSINETKLLKKLVFVVK